MATLSAITLLISIKSRSYIKILLFLLIGVSIIATIVFAKTEDGTSVAKPVVLYGTFNGSLVPIKTTSDGSLAIQ